MSVFIRIDNKFHTRANKISTKENTSEKEKNRSSTFCSDIICKIELRIRTSRIRMMQSMSSTKT